MSNTTKTVGKVWAVEVGSIVTVLPTKYGWDSFRGPAEVLDASGTEVAVWIAGQEVWFVAGARIEGVEYGARVCLVD